jgi:tRNA/rRNA methyltransferase
MNLGQSVAVCLYELIRSAKAPRPTEKPELASAGEVERITSLLLDTLRASGYLNPHSAAPTEEKIRRLVRRLNLDVHDAEVWLGILRQILWKLRE